MIFVTGGTGLIGSHLLFDLCSNESMPIRALFRSQERLESVRSVFKHYSPANWNTLFDKIEWVKGDILDVTDLKELIPNKSFVYHCAALVSFDDKFFNQLIHINRDGTENVVNACLENNVTKLCYVSSTAAIGGAEESVIHEKIKWKASPTTTGYSISKYCAEREVWRGIEEGLNAVMINPCVVLGAGNWKESSLTLLGTLQKGQKFYPPGANATVDARDVSKSMISLMHSDLHSERYLCVGSNQSFKDLMTEISQQLNVKAPTRLAKRWQINIVRRIMSFVSFFTRKRPSINRDTVENLFSSKTYETAKLEKAIGIKFRPLKEQVENAIKGRIH